MKLSEAIRKWKKSITTHMAVEYVLALRADINAFSDAAQVLEGENAKLRELAEEMLLYVAYPYVCVGPEVLVERARELGIEVE